MHGGDGIDLAAYVTSNAGVTIDLANATIIGGDAAGDTYTSIEGVLGSAHRDFLYGDVGTNAFLGSAGNDIIMGRGGADIISGDAGWDYALYTTSTAGVNINLTTGTNTGGDAEGDIIQQIEGIIGSSYDDTLMGDNGTNILKGESGNDTLNGMGGNDLLYGGIGNDQYIYISGLVTITETSGTDTLVFDPVWDINDMDLVTNTLTFDSSNTITFNDINLIEWFSFDGMNTMSLTELLTYTPPPPAADDDNFIATAAIEYFDGGIGDDAVDFVDSTAGVKVDLHNDTAHNGYAAGDDYDNIESLSGSAYRDWFWGNNGDNALYGMGGNDILEGGAGADTLDGGAGWDYARYTRSAAGVDVNLETNINTGGDAEGDLLNDIESVLGSSHNDTITGYASNEFLYGMDGTDTLNGRLGADNLYGGNDNDVFLFDAITAYSGIDNIQDFSLVQNDAIDLSDLLTAYDPNTQAIEDFVQITDDGTHSTVAVDAAGTGAAFIDIAQVLNVTGLTDEAALVNNGTLIV
jgi:Ca2+-binding RTX toxin-like protein